MNRIDALFARLRAEGRRALMPFITAGDPDLETTRELIVEVLARGASLVEVGIPYSDPIADGPTIAASYHRALTRGVNLSAIFAMLREVRAAIPADAPLVTMVSYSIVHRRGADRYLAEAAEAGVDGLIVPDLPVEESESLAAKVAALDLRLIQLVTPRTPPDRALAIARTTTGFLYYVSVAGLTGERSSFPPELARDVQALRAKVDLPICIGFGIGTPDAVRALAPIADGLIVGSALVRRLDGADTCDRSDVVREIGQFVADLAAGLEPGTTAEGIRPGVGP